MKKPFLHPFLLFTAVNLAACSSNPLRHIIPSYNQSNTKTNTNKGTELSTDEEMSLGSNTSGWSRSMDELDRSKMLHALDKAPGTPTYWRNGSTGISYTVTPVKKLVINGNPYCRNYTIIASKESRKKQSDGTACVDTDGNWKSIHN